MASHTKTLYTGITSELVKRVFQHRSKLTRGFTSKYNVDRLVYYESTTDVMAAIERGKQIKSWTRAKKLALIESMNPNWKDLSFSWYEGPDGSAKDAGSLDATPRSGEA